MTGDIIASVEPGLGPSEVLPTDNGRYLWVSLRNDGTVKRYDLWGFEAPVEVVIGPGSLPDSLRLTPDQRTLIVSMRAQVARLAFIDTRTMTLVKILEIGGTRPRGGRRRDSSGRDFRRSRGNVAGWSARLRHVRFGPVWRGRRGRR